MLPIIYDKLPYMLYTSIKLASPRKWQRWIVATCSSIA